MPRLFPAEDITLVQHLLEDIPVAYSRLHALNPLGSQCLVKPEIAHDRYDRRILNQLALFLKRAGQQIDNHISVDLAALFIDSQTAVRVAVKGDSDIRAFLDNRFRQFVQMSRAAAQIDVAAVRLVADNRQIRAGSFEIRRRRHHGSAVCAVDNYLHAGQIRMIAREDRLRVDPRRIFDPVYMVVLRDNIVMVRRDMRFDLVFHRIRKLIAFGAEEFDPVVFIRIVRRRDNNPRVRAEYARKHRHSGSRNHARQHHVSVRRRNTVT